MTSLKVSNQCTGRHCTFIGKNRTAPSEVRDRMKTTISEYTKYMHNVTLDFAYILTVRQIKTNAELMTIKDKFKNIDQIPPGSYFTECGGSGYASIQTYDDVIKFFKDGQKSPLCGTINFTLFWIDFSMPIYAINEKFTQPLPYSSLPTNIITQYLNLYYHEYKFQDPKTVKNIDEYTVIYC